ncbi:MAG TPA: SBBP repeat-containing protein, partial [Chitinophagales bacterium]|nr:SBBP repeat-containing protein [Chitinophagales bacterium]
MNNRTFTFKGALLCFLLMAAALPTALYAQQASAAVKDMSKDQIKHLIKESSNSIRFVDNNGQLPSDIKVAGLSNVGNVYLKKDHLYFVSVGSTAQEEHEEEEEEDEEYVMGPDGKLIEEHHGQQVAHRWGISFVGANEYNIERKNILPTKYNYFLDSDKTKWATNVSSYGEVELNNVYEGISMRMYSQEHNTMEFDWVVNAGADFRKIKMNFKGQDKLTLDEKGQLEVKLRFKEVKFDIPESYQVIGGKKVPVKMEFVIDGDVVSFKTSAKINSSYPLIIDPSLKWGTFFDDNDNDFDEYAYAVELDAVGNMYVAGASNNQLVRSATTGYGSYIFGYDSTYADGVSGSNVGRRDAIIYRIAANGSALQYVTYFGGTSPDVAYGLSLSPSGNALFVCGATNSDQGTSPGIPLVNTPFDGTKNGQDGFVAVFNSTLTSLTYSSYIGGTGTGDEMYSIRAINDNSYVIGGVVTSDGSFGSYISNGYSNNYRGGDEMYIGKFTNFRTLSWGTYIGGTGNDQLNDLQLFSDGAVAFSGASSSSTSFPALFNNVAQGVANSTGGIDGVIGVIPANGGNNVEMLSRFGGTGDDEFYGLAIGQFDSLFVTGYTSSTNFYLGPNSTGNRFQTTKGTGQDAFVGKLPRRGCQSCSTDPWVATYFGGNADDRGNTLRTYTPYAVMVFGETGSNRYPFNKNLDDGGAFFDSTFNGDTWDVFYMVLGTDLRTQYFGTLIGGSNNDYLGATGDPRGSNQFMVEGDSLICVATTTHSSSLTPDPIGNSFDLTNSTGGDDKHLVFKWRIGILLNFDYADAPASYGNPNHVVFNSLKLGSVIDKEDFPQPSYKADGDDLLTSDDEDGIAGTQVLVQDTSTTFTRSVSVTNQTGVTAMLMGWIDFNGDGDFLDANEVDTVLVPANATSATLRWTGYNASNIFRNAPNDTTYMRIRLT